MIIKNAMVDYSYSLKMNRKRSKSLFSPCTVIRPNGEVKIIPVEGMRKDGSIKKQYV